MVEKKEEDLKNVLDEIQALSEELFTAGATLSSVSENESASAEELAITSERLVESSNTLSLKTDESMNNLSELSEWKDMVADNVDKVETASRELLQKSEENSTKMSTQNEYLANVFRCMKGMTELLNNSVSAIGTMGEAHNRQSEVIKRTVSINQDIAESIRNTNDQFNSINTMAERNASDTTSVAAQALLTKWLIK